ncbi:hypothetical protein AB7M74_003152 [Bradyrhizobium japonicum]
MRVNETNRRRKSSASSAILPMSRWVGRCCPKLGGSAPMCWISTGQVLGASTSAIANPPFGATPRTGNGPCYTGRSFEFHVIDLASDIADYGAFIIPQMSAPFGYSGVQCYRERKTADFLTFAEQTGIHLEAGCGVDCAYYRDAWKGVRPTSKLSVRTLKTCSVNRFAQRPIPRLSCAPSGPKRGCPQDGRMP